MHVARNVLTKVRVLPVDEVVVVVLVVVVVDVAMVAVTTVAET